jgi:hypothetical protein
VNITQRQVKRRMTTNEHGWKLFPEFKPGQSEAPARIAPDEMILHQDIDTFTF